MFVQVIDTQTGKSVTPGVPGEICIKSPAVMLGYLNNQKATAETIDPDGWVHTGN